MFMRKARVARTFLVIALTWSLKFSFVSMLTQKYFAVSAVSTVLPCIV